ncbi:hypothetical protein PROVRETT_07348 [Providencia rettgeri DSM 1131]|nr:hypothetical protein PROVRETT_07348 [Providencia rettgeri DSM 1131]
MLNSNYIMWLLVFSLNLPNGLACRYTFGEVRVPHRVPAMHWLFTLRC